MPRSGFITNDALDDAFVFVRREAALLFTESNNDPQEDSSLLSLKEIAIKYNITADNFNKFRVAVGRNRDANRNAAWYERNEGSVETFRPSGISDLINRYRD